MSKVKVDTLETQTGTLRSIPMDRVAQGVAAAWANFNGTGTVAIRAAYNVSSITDVGVGQYVANFTNPLPSALYAAPMSAWSPAVSDAMAGIAGRATNSLTINLANSGGSAVDAAEVSFAVFQ